jgi:hypothetical protein
MTLLTVIRVLALTCLVAGCGGSSSSGHANGPRPIANSAKQPLAGMLPVVDGSDVLATVWTGSGEVSRADAFRRQVPVLVIVDARGEYHAAAPPLRWQELGTYQLEATNPLDVSRLDRILAEGRGLARTPREIVADLAAPANDEIDIELSTSMDHSTSVDDPPPPEEEDLPDDGADETGGTGTALAPDEGRMGRKDSDRAEGQYKMRRNQDDPQLAAQQAKERARAAALEAKGLFRGSRVPSRTTTKPTRVSTTSGFIDPDEKLPFQSATIVAHPTAKAAAVVALLAKGVGDSILVAHGKDVRPLRLLFGREGVEPSRKSWIEVRAHQGAFIVQGVPGTPQRAPVPRAQLAGPYAAFVADARFGKASPVDVLVDDELTAQGLIDVLVALDRAGARSISVGHVPAPGSPQATLRGSSR